MISKEQKTDCEMCFHSTVHGDERNGKKSRYKMLKSSELHHNSKVKLFPSLRAPIFPSRVKQKILTYSKYFVVECCLCQRKSDWLRPGTGLEYSVIYLSVVSLHGIY